MNRHVGRVCKRCCQWKPAEMFYFDKTRGILYSKCKACFSACYTIGRVRTPRQIKPWWDKRTPRQRFESMCEQSGDCILWRGAVNTNGYGAFSYKCRPHQAHRAAWMLFVGDIPAGMQVNHHCDVRLCVNIEHLYIGTQSENISDMWRRNRRSGA